MDIHKLLKRQLIKANILDDKKPESDAQWLAFIERVNNAYKEADQERYMHERSMELSSREMMGLNARLETAQRIAKLGYWYYNGNTDTSIWTKEIYSIFNLDPLTKPPTYKQYLTLVYENDRYEVEEKITRALNERVNYEYEARIKNPGGVYRWYRVIGQCLEGKQLEGIIIDIHNNKMTEEKIKELNQQILLTARQAGMAEVATMILHNIGNILNSSNVSINMLKDSFKNTYQKKLFKVLEILKEHESDISDFLVNDSKGKLVPQYLVALAKVLLEEGIKNSAEIDSLINDLKLINQIVEMQNSVSGAPSMKEKVYIPEVIETALKMAISTLNNGVINITKAFEICPSIDIDKSKLLQILINVIQNARDSVLQNSSKQTKEIKLSVNKTDNNSIQIVIADNGVGIERPNLQRIFAFGFTTKTNGHGFGLHSSALSANEMGGALLAHSQGKGCGAQFILTLPISSSEIEGAAHE